MFVLKNINVEQAVTYTFTGTSTLRSFTTSMVATNFPGFDGQIWFTQGAGYTTATTSIVSASPSSVFSSSAPSGKRIGSVIINSSDFASDFLTASGLSALPSNTNADLTNPVIVKVTTTRTNGSNPGTGELIFRARGVTRFTSMPNLIFMHNSSNSPLPTADYISGSGTFDQVGGHTSDVQTIQIGTVSAN